MSENAHKYSLPDTHEPSLILGEKGEGVLLGGTQEGIKPFSQLNQIWMLGVGGCGCNMILHVFSQLFKTLCSV